MKKKVVVIGAGLTGLTIAHYLNKSGIDFVVIEKNNRVGGVIDTVEEQGFLCETGPNTGVIGNPEVAELFEDLKGLCELEVPKSNVKKRYILKGGKWRALPSGLISGISTPLFSLKDKIRILGEPFRKPGTDPNENLSDFVKRRMGESFLDYAVDPFVKGVYAGDTNFLIPKYALPKLYNLEQEYGSFIGGAIKKKKASKGDLRLKKATKEVFSAKGGLKTFVDALYQSAGENNFILNSASVTTEKNESNYIIQTESGKSFETENLITTCGAYALPDILQFVNQDNLGKISNLHYTKVVELIIGYNKWKGINLDGFGGLIPTKEKRDILGVLYLSAFLEGRAPKGGALVTVFAGGFSNESLVDKPDQEIKEVVAKEFIDLMGVDDFTPDLLKIIRHQKAIPQFGINGADHFSAIDKIQQENKGLFLAGNIRDGIGMADRIKQGKDIADQMLN